MAYLYLKGWFAIDLISTVPVSHSRRAIHCHSADAPSPTLSKRLLKGEGGAAE